MNIELTFSEDLYCRILGEWLQAHVYQVPVTVRKVEVMGKDQIVMADLEASLLGIAAAAVQPSAAVQPVEAQSPKAAPEPSNNKPKATAKGKGKMTTVDTPHGQLVECPVCHEMFHSKGIGVHKARAHPDYVELAEGQTDDPYVNGK